MSEEQRTDAVNNDNSKTVSDTEKVLAELKAKVETNLAGWQRAQADFVNYKKRSEQEKEEVVKYANSALVRNILPILDDFERALKHLEDTDNIEAFREGEKLIFTKLKTILEQKGLQEIKSVGEPFNTDLHDAITNIPSPSDEQKGKIIAETQKGYLLNGKVIRYAKVAVAS